MSPHHIELKQLVLHCVTRQLHSSVSLWGQTATDGERILKSEIHKAGGAGADWRVGFSSHLRPLINLVMRAELLLHKLVK